MKYLHHVPKVLVFISVFVVFSTFGADSNVKEGDGMLERYLGVGNVLSGVHEYFTTLHERTLSFKEIVGMVGGTVNLAAFGAAWRKDDEEASMPSTVLLFLSGALAVCNVSLLYEVIGVIRKKQKVRAGESVKDNEIKKYINVLLDYSYFEDDIRFELLKQYRKKQPDQLRKCAKEVLIEKKLCEEKEDGSGIKCIGNLVETIDFSMYHGDMTLWQAPKLKLLHKILKDDEDPGPGVYKGQQAVIDDLFNRHDNQYRNIKGARR